MKKSDPRLRDILKETYTPPIHNANDGVVSNTVKNMIKRWPRLYNFIKKVVGPSHSPGNRYNLQKSIHELFGNTIQDAVILNLGSGTYRVHPEIINVDIFPFKEVDIVADICDMPFRDASVDGIVCEDVMEHIAHAPRLFQEIARVLKPGGMLMVKTPFLYPYHSSPNDFFRWTEDGMKHMLREHDFIIKKSGVHGGPMGALQGILMHVFAMIFSFSSKTVYFFLVQCFMVLLSPLKLLDPLFMLSPFALDVASDIFIIAKKN